MVSWKITGFFLDIFPAINLHFVRGIPNQPCLPSLSEDTYVFINIYSTILENYFLKKRISTTIEPPFVMNDQPICHMPLSELRGADLDPPANPSAILFCPPDLPHRCLRSFDHSLTGWGPTVMFVGLQTLIIPINYSHIYHKPLLSHL